VYLDKGDYDSAIRNYERALELKPDSVWVYNNLGLAYLNAGKLDDAERQLRKAVESDPQRRCPQQPWFGAGPQGPLKEALDFVPSRVGTGRDVSKSRAERGRYRRLIQAEGAFEGPSGPPKSSAKLKQESLESLDLILGV
jgi:tetratricopeptide (TPR) repeat protein